MKTSTIDKQFDDFILQNDHPCLMAQSVFNLDNCVINDYERLISIDNSFRLLIDLEAYLEDYNFESKNFKSFIAVFSKENISSEENFEKLLWQQLKMLSELDTHKWDQTVNADPNHKNFSYSLLGKSFYIVGMHPKSSRMARKSPYIALVFNLHWQFEKLREMRKYDFIRTKIRERDVELQGSINPMLEDFGESSEAKQYSGRKVDKSWKCPFH